MDKSSLKNKNFFVSDGNAREGFVILPNQPNQLKCFTDDDSQIGQIRITGIGSSWHTVEGIRIGTMLEEFVKMNGKPIDFLWICIGLQRNDSFF